MKSIMIGGLALSIQAECQLAEANRFVFLYVAFLNFCSLNDDFISGLDGLEANRSSESAELLKAQQEVTHQCMEKHRYYIYH